MSDQHATPTEWDPPPTTPHAPPFVPPLATETMAPGTLLQGRYALERVLGHGAMGQVYLGRDEMLHRQVAIKLIRPRDPNLRNRTLVEGYLREAFVDEARIGAGLTHPAIATVFDFGFHGTEPFIVFEYIAGETLREVIHRRGRLPLEEARLIVGPLAQALDFAHSRHVIHRDLKPENIRATDQGHFKVLDLGLAREFRHALDWSFAGTPAYSSPEQAAGLPCDGRADQYALALIAHELIVGRWLFEAPDWQEMLRQHREEPAPSPLRFVPDLPESVCTALLRALEKDPNRRFTSCQEFAVALGCQLLNAPVPQAEVLRLTAVSRMRGLWNSPRLRLFRKGTAVYLALSPDALWVSHRGEFRRLPLAALVECSQGGWGKELRLRLRRGGRDVSQSFHFSRRAECTEWCALVQEAKGRLTAEAVSEDWPAVGPVVLMGRPPEMRYQTLGTVDHRDTSARRAEFGLQVRAAQLGADAVVDVQEERLPELGKTVHRRSGLAIRAVDTTGRQELRSRWFASQVAQLSTWMLLLVGISFGGTLLTSIVFALLAQGGVGIPLGMDETLGHRLGLVVVVVVLIHAWPFALVLLTRWLQWPQLLRPAALAILFLGAKPLTGLVGALLAWLATGRWAGSALFFCAVLDPINLGILLFALFVFRRGWLAYREYRELIPDADRLIPATRRRVERGALATTALVGVLVAGYLGWGQYQFTAQFALPGEAGKEREALAAFQDGVARLQQDPAGAEQSFLRALPLWEELVAAFPNRPEPRHNLGATHQNLGIIRMRKGKVPEALESFRAALAQYDGLSRDHPGYQQHRLNHEQVRKTLAQMENLPALQVHLEEAREAEQGRRLSAAGQHRAALEHYHQVVVRHEKRRQEFADKALYRRLLAFKQNRLAWYLANCPDPRLRDPGQAIEVARRVVATFPNEGGFRTTLGIVYYRAGRWKECEAEITRSIQLRRAGDGFDWLFLAMACQRLGKGDEARQWLDRGVAWMTRMQQGKFAHPVEQGVWQAMRPELERFRREAEELIRPR